MDFIGNLFQGAVWLLCVGALAVIVVLAIVVGGIRRASGRTAPEPQSDAGGLAPAPHSDPMARYQGGDARTTTESTAATSTDPIIGSSGDVEERTQ